MSITPAQLLTLVNQETGRQESDLTQYLRDTIHEVESQSIFLEAEASFTLTTDDDEYPLSSTTLDPVSPAFSLFRRPFHLQPVDSAGEEWEELTEVSKDELQRLRAYNANSSRPQNFCVWNNVLQLWPKPSSSYPSMKLWGTLYHSDDVTTISYPDKYRRMLVSGCSWYVFLRYGLGETEKAKIQKAVFDSELSLQSSRKANERPRFVRYND